MSRNCFIPKALRRRPVMDRLAHYGMERPEPYYGMVKIVKEHETPDQSCVLTRYLDGRYALVPKAHVFEPGTVTGNGPACMPWDDIRGNISDSEGMDCPNYIFNNTDCGASF